MKNTRMIIWVMLLTLAAALLAGCDGSQNPTMPQQLPETAPTTVTQPLPAPTENQSQQYELLPPPVQTEAPTQPTEPAAVLLDGTWLLFVGDEEAIRNAFSVQPREGAVFLPHVMSRKKQIIPSLSALWG